MSQTSATKGRVTYILSNYPQVSQTYIQAELDVLKGDYEIQIISFGEPDAPYRNHLPFRYIDQPEAVLEAVRDFRPDVIHTHWLRNTRTAAYVAGFFSNELNTPFTVRAHSFDVLGRSGRWVGESAPLLNMELCLGVLTFPFGRQILQKAGVRDEKIINCYPVVNFKRFYDRSPNGNAVMNVGACTPKKRMEDFLELATRVPDREFNLYALGYYAPLIAQKNTEMGNPVNIVPPVEPGEMLPEYKKHQWLVYTACRKLNTVGWPLAVAEAQAAGVGVCVAKVREDMREFVGEAGFLFDSISEIESIVSQPVPEEIREAGFIQARKSDVCKHKTLLTSLWDGAIAETHNTYEPGDSPDVPVWGEGGGVLEQEYTAQRAIREFREVIPSGSVVVHAGDPEQWCLRRAGKDYRLIPFLERDGDYWGEPEKSEQAIVELERLRMAGASYFVVGRPAFWWLDYYAELNQQLRVKYRCAFSNERLVVFDLRT